jgi:hypothetical protein
MKTGITLITMGAGNVKVLGKTLESFSGICDEVIYGDLLVFEEDRQVLAEYHKKYNMAVIHLPFSYIFQNGFSDTLNLLASCASNDMILYMNTSEIVDEDYGVVEAVKDNPDCNSFYFTHRTDPHRWFRLYNRKDLKWSGVIHEQLAGEYRPYHKPVFMMADLEKDMDDERKASILNSIKEIVYFNNYLKIADGDKEALGETDPGWVKFAAENKENMHERMIANGMLYDAFYLFDRSRLYYAIKNYKKDIPFESSDLIEYQGDKKYLL